MPHASPQPVSADLPLRSHCCYCSMQCGIEVHAKPDGSGYEVKPSPVFPVATGRLCRKGFHSIGHVDHPNRLTVPLFRGRSPDGLPADGWTAVDWDFALDGIAGSIRSLQERYGPDSIAVFGGGPLTNEACYLLGKFARIGLGTRYVVCSGRSCMPSAATAQTLAFGVDRGLTFPLDDLPLARYIVVAGTNIAECQPTMMPDLMAAKKQGAVVVAIDPHDAMTAKIADACVRPQPGFGDVFVRSLLHVLLEENLYDRRFVEERTVGIDLLRETVRPFAPEAVQPYTGVPAEAARGIARGFARAETGVVLTARGLEQQANGVEHALSYIHLCLLTGKIGRPGCGYGSIAGQANEPRGCELGQMADQLPGGRPIEDPEARRHVAAVWGVEPDAIPGKGVSACELFEKMETGEIKGLIAFGANPVVSSPNASRALSAMSRLELCVVIDLFETETAACADWLLPGSSFLETEGTLTNLEGRVFHRPRVFRKPPGGMEDYEILCALARRLGQGQWFDYDGAEAIFRELCRASSGGKADYGGLSYARLRERQGIFWPCPAPGHPGTPRMFERAFAHPDGKARLHGIVPGKPAEEPSAEYPYLLTTGRLGSHDASGARTRRSEAPRHRAPFPVAEIHPSLAQQLGLKPGDRLRIASRRGSAVFACKIAADIHPTTVFVPFHGDGEQSVNRLTSDALPPVGRVPEFKIAAVRVEPVRNGGDA